MYYKKEIMVKVIQDHLIGVLEDLAGDQYTLEAKGIDATLHIAQDIIDLLEKYIDEEDDKSSWNGN